MKARNESPLIVGLFIVGVAMIGLAGQVTPSEPNQSILVAHIRDSQEQMITAMELGEPDCDAWQTSKDTTVRCVWHVDNRIPIMSCPNGQLIPEKYQMNGDINRFCARTLD